MRRFIVAVAATGLIGCGGAGDERPDAGAPMEDMMTPPVAASATGDSGTGVRPDPPEITRDPMRTPRSSFNEAGLRMLEEGKYNEAAGEFARAVRARPRDAEFRNNYGWALYLAGRRSEAERELLAVVTQSPDRAIAYANLGEARLQRQDTMAAITAYRKFLSLNRDPRRDRIARDRLSEIQGGK